MFSILTPMKLTQEEKRIKIAEACGHTNRWCLMRHGVYLRPKDLGYTWSPKEAWKVNEEVAKQWQYNTKDQGDDVVRIFPADIPDYFNDLNACHEMELTLHERAWATKDYFCNLLYNLVRPNRMGGLNHGLLYVSATAAQRAEAFGLTLNLWTAED